MAAQTVPQIILRPYKWTCGGFNGGQDLQMVSVGDEQSLTLNNIGNNFWYGCGDFTYPITEANGGGLLAAATGEAEPDRLFFGWRANSVQAVTYAQGGQISIKSWVESSVV